MCITVNCENNRFPDDDTLDTWCLNFMEGDEKKNGDVRWRPQYLICAKETGASGNNHLQIYAYFATRLRPGTTFIDHVVRVFGRGHVSCAVGSPKQNITYCKKGQMTHDEWQQAKRRGDPTLHASYGVDADFKEYGDPPQQGRDNLDEVFEDIKEGRKRVQDICWENPRLYGRNVRTLLDLQKIVDQNNSMTFRNVEVRVLWGEAGSGKTRYVHEQCDPKDLYVYTHNQGHNCWYDGYNGQSNILFDDFYGGQVSYSEVLRLWDGYSTRLQVKGSTVWAKWNTVWITSNVCPCKWYSNPRAWDQQAFRRRITSIEKWGNVPDCNHEAPIPVVLDHDADVQPARRAGRRNR